jgi:hypothetical protein
MASRQVRRFAQQLAQRAVRRKHAGHTSDRDESVKSTELDDGSFVVDVAFRNDDDELVTTHWRVVDGDKRAIELTPEQAAELRG